MQSHIPLLCLLQPAAHRGRMHAQMFRDFRKTVAIAAIGRVDESRRGVVYLCAILDWASRRVLAWRLSNTLTTDFCLEVVREAITQYGRPEIFNTDQGCQFTSQEFTGLLKDQGIQISMDDKGCWRDNVFVERLW